MSKLIRSLKAKTNLGCDLCQAVLRSFSILLFSLAVVRAASQQWHCYKAQRSFILTSDDIQWKIKTMLEYMNLPLSLFIP